MSRYISLVALLGILAIIVLLTYRVLAGFLLPLVLAVILAVIFGPVHRWLLDRMPKAPRIAAFLATMSVALSVLAPAALVFGLAGVEITDLVTRFDAAKVESRVAQWRSTLGLEMPRAADHRRISELLRRLEAHVRAGGSYELRHEIIVAVLNRLNRLDRAADIEEGSPAGDRLNELRQVLRTLDDETLDISDREALAEQASAYYQRLEFTMLGGPVQTTLKKLANPAPEEVRRWLLQTTNAIRSDVVSATGRTTAVVGKALILTGIMLVAIYFFFADGDKMIAAGSRLSPLDKRYERELLLEFSRTSRAIVLATLLSAAVQGVLAGFGYWLAGVQAVFLLVLLTTVLAMVPFLGAGAVWLPTALYLIVIEERVLAGVLLIVYGAGVVSLSDNVVRPVVLHGQTKLHPLLALLSVLGGAQALGPVGIFVGPMVVVFLQTLLNIVHRELMAISSRAAPGAG